MAREAAGGDEGPPSLQGPLVVGGLVVAAGGGTPADQLSAYDAGTGRPRWHYRSGGVVYLWAASPRAVVVGSDRGELDALEPATGRRRWRLRLAPEQDVDAATLSGDRLVVATSYPGEGDLRPPVVYALDAGSGRRRWRAVLRRGTDLQWGAPVLAGGLVLVASTPSHPGSAPGHALHALDAASGRARWELALPSSQPVFHSERPLPDRGLVLVPAVGALLAVDPGSGRERWRRPGPGLPALLGAAGGLVLTMAGDGLVALEAGGGRERWRLPLAADRHRFATLSRGRVDVVAAGLLRVVDPATGGELWRSPTGPAAGPPLRTAGRVYVPTSDGLVALEAASGRLAWVGNRCRLAGGPLAAGGRVVVASRAGDLLGYAP